MNEKEREAPNTRQAEGGEIGRKEFLKTAGLLVGALGLGAAAGGDALGAPNSQESNRRAIQAFVRELVRDPATIQEFLEHPADVARRFGVELTEREIANVRQGFLRIAAEQAAPTVPDKKLTPGKIPSSRGGVKAKEWTQKPGWSDFAKPIQKPDIRTRGK